MNLLTKDFCHSSADRADGRDPDTQPHSWMRAEKDLRSREHLLVFFRLFIERLAASGLSPEDQSKITLT